MEITDLANGNARFQMKIGGASEEFRGILDKIDVEKAPLPLVST